MSSGKPNRKRPGEDEAGATLTASEETLHVGDVPKVTPAPFEQPPAPVATPEPPATEQAPAPKKTAKAEPKPKEPAAAPAGDASAREAWEASVMLARLSPREWEAYTVRLPEELWERLEARVEADQAAYGLATLAMSHYVNAGLERIPADTKEAAAIATARLASLGLRPPATRSSGTRVHRDVLKRMELLPAQLRRVARPGLIGHLQAAAIEVFLDELDAE